MEWVDGEGEAKRDGTHCRPSHMLLTSVKEGEMPLRVVTPRYVRLMNLLEIPHKMREENQTQRVT